MNPIRKLFEQTAIYGIGHMVGRILNFALVPLYVSQFSPEEYGKVTDLYALVVFAMVFLTYGMETAFFRYIQDADEPNAVFRTGMRSLIATTAVFLAVVMLGLEPIARVLQYTDHPEYLLFFAGILAFDALSALPLALLRAKGKAGRFAWIKLSNIGINVGLNLVLILGFKGWGIEAIFIANLVASGWMFLLLLPEWKGLRGPGDPILWKKMIQYGWPILFAGLAGAVNEVADRQFLKYLLPDDEAIRNLGIYGANYKLAIFITLFIQAFRYGAEPFFFAQAKGDKQIYARVMDVFVAFVALIYLGLRLFLNELGSWFIPNEVYREGLHIVPILLLANVGLGLLTNLSVWYKVTDRTRAGATIALFGAVITIGLNLWWIPLWGYTGAAWATLVSYGSMTLLSYFWGRKHFAIPYHWIKNLGSIAAVVVVAEGASRMEAPAPLNTLIFIIFAGVFVFMEKSHLQSVRNE